MTHSFISFLALAIDIKKKQGDDTTDRDKKSQKRLDVFVLVSIRNFCSYWFETIRSSKYDAPFSYISHRLNPMTVYTEQPEGLVKVLKTIFEINFMDNFYIRATFGTVTVGAYGEFIVSSQTIFVSR